MHPCFCYSILTRIICILYSRTEHVSYFSLFVSSASHNCVCVFFFYLTWFGDTVLTKFNLISMFIILNIWQINTRCSVPICTPWLQAYLRPCWGCTLLTMYENTHTSLLAFKLLTFLPMDEP